MGHGMAKNIVEKGYPLTVHRPPQPRAGRGSGRPRRQRGEVAEATSPRRRHRLHLRHRFARGRGDRFAARRPEGRAEARHDRRRLLDRRSVLDPRARGRTQRAGVDVVDAPLRTPKEAGRHARRHGRARHRNLRAPGAGARHLGRPRRPHRGHRRRPRMKLLNNFISMGYAALYSEALALAQRSASRRSCSTASSATAAWTAGFYRTFMRWTLDRPPRRPQVHAAQRLQGHRYLESSPTRRPAIPCGTPSRTATRSPWPPAALTTTFRCSATAVAKLERHHADAEGKECRI